MNRIFIIGMGIISPPGCGIDQTLDSVRCARRGIKPLSVFPAKKILPVGEITGDLQKEDDAPRTHQLALIAAKEAMAGVSGSPEAVVLGGTTGGILTTEEFLKENNLQPDLFRYHAVSSVAEYIARKFRCKGPVISVSTACSSGTAAICIAAEMLRTGKVKNALAGGADSLCRLTYYGFNSLQAVDPDGARPFDRRRKGMTVSEGAAMLYLVSASHAPDGAVAEIIGGGLSCDAYHPTAPHPDGKGAYRAMMTAMNNAGISPCDIDYINLHGTGTVDNDLSEAKALRAIWGDSLPCVSSVKGAFGHAIAASGAVEAVITALSIANGCIPSNEGFSEPDPALGVYPVTAPVSGVAVETALSNSFGFGGNNATVILSNPRKDRIPSASERRNPFSVIGSACITGAGGTKNTFNALTEGASCQGTAGIRELCSHLSPKVIRRIKRLPKMTLSLAVSACPTPPSSVFFGTGWGPLSETYDFLKQLYDTQEQFSSPTDFVGSVHNAPAGQAAMLLNASGPNITATVGDYSFDHALFIADIMTENSDDPVLVIGADEFHPALSPLFDPPASADETPSDGGGAVCLTRKTLPSSVKLHPVFTAYADENPSAVSDLIRALGRTRIQEKYDAVFAGIPGAFRQKAAAQIRRFISDSGFRNPVIDYRKQTGEFASASAAAAVIALQCAAGGKIPARICGRDSDYRLNRNSILILNLGKFVTAIEVFV